jgi:Zn-dependent protease/CBS domain-containing protein
MSGMSADEGRDGTGRSGRSRPDRGEEIAPPGIQIGRPFGVPVYISPTWFVIALLITVSFAQTVELAVPSLGAGRYAVSFSFAVLLLLSVLAHELSHTVVALRLGYPVRRITLHLLGGASEVEGTARRPAEEFYIAVAGPLVSLLLGGIAYVVALGLSHDTVAGLLADALTVTNIFVGIFNLLPGLPLDGGRVLQAGVWRATGNRLTGVAVAARAGLGLAGVVFFIPLLLAVRTGRSVDLFDIALGALVASFIWLGARSSLTSAKLQERVPQLSARQLARRAIPVASTLPLSEALRLAGEAGARGLVVVDGDGKPTGIVSEAAVLATPVPRRPWVHVSDLARRLDDAMAVRSDLTGADLIAAMQRAPATEYLVVEPTGEVYGVLSTADVEARVTGRAPDPS